MTEGEVLVPTRRSRLRMLMNALVPITVAVLWGVGAQAFREKVLPLPLCEQMPWARTVVLAAGATLLMAMWWLGQRAWRVHRSGRYPPPGTAVFFRTRVWRGWMAQAQAVSYLGFCGVLAWAFVALASWEGTRAIFSTCVG